jgi:hypothetical protein
MEAVAKKTFTVSTVGDNSGYASMRVINMLDSLAFEGEASPLKHHWKRTRKSPSPKVSLKPSQVPAIEGLTA